MRDELLRIMNLVKDGKLTPEQAVELAETMGVFSEPKQQVSGKKRMFYIQVRSNDGEKVDVKIPVGLAQLLKLSLPVLQEKVPNVNLNLLSEQLDEAMKNLSELEGDILNVTGSDGTTVRIFVD
ncbi:MAG TPA: hypothetical protein PLP64_03690 [Pseudothermotoga sp.]|nr:hypothetical protein [Pseudothermotoga sp.]HOK83309.1 hypothetical protein [Pseudothermotoga sp.]HPP70134.1 hypothetical protein [Pseudothermotoga sp.]